MNLSIDFETASLGNLKKMGSWKYARQPSTRVLCLAFAPDDTLDDPDLWFPELDGPPPRALTQAIAEGAALHAWGAHFEFAIWSLVGPSIGLPPLPIDRFHCSMSRALYWGAPPALEQAGPAVGANEFKDDEGHKLMLRMARPRGFTADGEPRWWDREEPDRLRRLGEYCRQDVRTEKSVVRRLPPMSAYERRVWLVDHRMNAKGLHVDIPTVAQMQRVVDEEVDRLGRRFAALTKGAISKPTQAARIVKYLQDDGLPIESLDKRLLPDTLKRLTLTDHQRDVVDLYKEGAKTSTAKLRAMVDFRDHDGRVRNLIQYGGALRTLRFAGRGVQIQNYPRPWKAYETNWAVDDIVAGLSAAGVALVHGSPMETVSRCLRGCYTPAPGHALVVCDYSAIEARVIAWLAGQEDILAVFRRGEDVYRYAAAGVGSDSRDLGKVLVLACGFGMGPPRFVATAAGYGVILTLDQAEQNVWQWRDNNSHIVDSWYDCDRAAREVIESQSTEPHVVGKIHFRMAKPQGRLAGAMLLRLPSERYIVYRNARLEYDDDWGSDRIVYDGLDLAKRWTRIRTWGGKIMENATQAVARDLLVDAMLRLDDENDDLCVTNHDELVAEPWLSDASERFAQIKREMSKGPAWAAGLPLSAEGAVLMRYGKP